MTTVGLDLAREVGPGGRTLQQRPAAAPRPDPASERRASALSLAVAAAVIGVLAAPLLFTENGFASDFTNLAWLSSVQSATVTHGLIPSFFINTTGTSPLPAGYAYPYPQTGLFDPVYAFYGGPLLANVGYLSVALGHHVIAAFVLVSLLAFAAAYRGVYWCARLAGCRRVVSHAAAITFVASAYYLTDLYGRSDWLEFVAVSALPLFAASLAAILWQPKVRASSLAWLYVTAVFLGGSHNTTLLWGSIFLALVAAILLASRAVPLPARRRVLLFAVVAFLGVGLNGWAILPALAYASHTYFVHAESVIGTPFMDTFTHLFDPLRMVPRESTTPALYVQVVDWMLAWALVAGAVLCAVRGSRLERRLFVAFCTLSGLCLFYLLNRQIWQVMPHLLWTIQNPFLLGTYFTLSVCALLIAVGSSSALRNPRARRRVAIGTLVGCAAVTLALGAWQALVPNDRQPIESYVNRYDALTGVDTLPKSWYAVLDWVDQQLPVVAVDPNRFVTLPAAVVDAHGDGIDTLMSTPAGPAPIGINVVAVPDLITLGGDLRVIGRTSSGYLAVTRAAAVTGPARLIVGTARSKPILLGRLWTALSAAGALLGTAAFAVRARRRQRVTAAAGIG